MTLHWDDYDTFVVECDSCRVATLETNTDDHQEALREAAREGWRTDTANGAHACPGCQERSALTELIYRG